MLQGRRHGEAPNFNGVSSKTVQLHAIKPEMTPTCEGSLCSTVGFSVLLGYMCSLKVWVFRDLVLWPPGSLRKYSRLRAPKKNKLHGTVTRVAFPLVGSRRHAPELLSCYGMS